MAPDGDPAKHRTSIKTSKLELTNVVVPLIDFERAVQVCRALVQGPLIEPQVVMRGNRQSLTDSELVGVFSSCKSLIHPLQ